MKKQMILLIVMLFPLLCFASEGKNDALAALASKKAKNDLAAFSEALSACKDSEGTLPKDVFSGLSLSKEQQKTALMYHAIKASYECVKPAMSNFLISSSVLAHYDPEKALGLTQGATLVAFDAIQLFKLEIEYQELSVSTREQLSTIEALQKPFDMMLSADNLGL